MTVYFDFKPSQDLTEAEKTAGTKLTTAEGDDDARRAAVAAGTRQPPGKGERPYLIHSRGRAAVHTANSNELGTMVKEGIDLSESHSKITQYFEELDKKADKLELRFWNGWLSVEDPAKHGRLGFYPNEARSDYGNPSHDRNRNWWDRAAKAFRPDEGADPVALPAPIMAFRDEILEIADSYGTTLNTLRTTEDKLIGKWKELVALGRRVRKDRRSTRSFLKEDFDVDARWTNELVAPLADTKGTQPRGGSGGS